MKIGTLKYITAIFIFFLAFFFSLSPILAKSGCCSWHDGVSHCDTSTGRYVCNDGTYSPSCTCAKYTTPTTYTSLPQTKSPTSNNSDDSLAWTLIIGVGGIIGYALFHSKNQG